MTWANCWLTVQPTAPTTIKDRTTTISVENMRPKCMRSRSLATGVRMKGYEDGESKRDQDDASEIESADYDDGEDHAEKNRQRFCLWCDGSLILGHWPNSPLPESARRNAR